MCLCNPSLALPLSLHPQVRAGDSTLSLLPPWHIYQRSVAYYLFSRCGCNSYSHSYSYNSYSNIVNFMLVYGGGRRGEGGTGRGEGFWGGWDGMGEGEGVRVERQGYSVYH
jgi:hypothetical protein